MNITDIKDLKPKQVDWNQAADFYNKMAMMELADTERQIDCMGLDPSDSVLDMCCGPGRISIVAARQVQSVTAADSAERMLAYCEQNVARYNLTNIKTKLIDWYDVVPGVNLFKHDVVIASRNGAISDVEKLSSLALRKVAVVIWANGPNIPQLTNRLFDGCGALGFGGDGRSKGGRANMAPNLEHGYLDIAKKAFEAGYEPSVQVVDDGFENVFACEEEAHAFLFSLRPDQAVGNESRIIANAKPYLEVLPDGSVRFRMDTRSAVITWDI